MKKIFVLTGEPSGDKLASTLISRLKQENSEIDMMNDVESSESTEEPTSPSESMNASEVEETEVNSIEAEEVSESIDIAPETETVTQEENDTKD